MIHNRCPEWLKKKFATATSPGMAKLPVESVEEPGVAKQSCRPKITSSP